MQEIKHEWDVIHEIMKDYKPHELNESKILLYGNPEFDDYNEVLFSNKTPTQRVMEE